MMMRSAPPASANLAEMPVPAPTPSRQPPCRRVSRSLAMHFSRQDMCAPGRSEPAPAQQGKEFGYDSTRELRVVYVRVQFHHLDSGMTANCVEQSNVRFRVVKGLACRVNRRDPPKRTHNTGR